MKKQRICLKCQNEFPSTHIGNRICVACRNNTRAVYEKAPLTVVKDSDEDDRLKDY